jgi:hypothetical protein
MASNNSILKSIHGLWNDASPLTGIGSSGGMKGAGGQIQYNGLLDQYEHIAPDGKRVSIPAAMINQEALNTRRYNPNPVPSNPSPLSSLIESEAYRHKLLAMRLRIPEGTKMPYQDLFSSLAGDKVFVFIVQDNQAVTLEDSTVMFPSDQLITQLRLLDK